MRVMKPGTNRLTGHVTCTKEKINAGKVLVRHHKGER
jgi:hypothetical protein